MLLDSLDMIKPTIWRRIRVPEAYTLHQLHRVLQLVFSWVDYHLYVFEVGDRRFKHELFEDLEGDLATDQALESPSGPAAADLLSRLPRTFDPERFDVESGDRLLSLVTAWRAI